VFPKIDVIEVMVNAIHSGRSNYTNIYYIWPLCITFTIIFYNVYWVSFVF